jgi:hypothetical protein
VAHLGVGMTDHPVGGHALADPQVFAVDLDILAHYRRQQIGCGDHRLIGFDFLGVGRVENVDGQQHHLLQLLPAGRRVLPVDVGLDRRRLQCRRRHRRVEVAAQRPSQTAGDLA